MRNGVTPLRQLLALLVHEQRHVRPRRRGRTERLPQHLLLRRVRQMLLGADDERDPHRQIVDNVGEQEHRRPVATQQHEIVDRVVIENRLATNEIATVVDPGRGTRKRSTRRAPGSSDRSRQNPSYPPPFSPAASFRASTASRAALAAVSRSRSRPAEAQRHDVRPRTRSADNLVINSTIRADADPGERLVDAVDPLLTIAFGVGVFDPQNERAALFPGDDPVVERGARSPNVQESRRRRGETNSDTRHDPCHATGENWQNAAMRLQGKVALITGAGNGIGRACAQRFAEEGAKIVVADLIEAAALETVALVEGAGGSAAFVKLDAASKRDNELAAQFAVDTYGAIDLVVTAAGISHSDYHSGDIEHDIKMVVGQLEYAEKPGRAFVELAADSWQKVIDVNLTGTFYALQACAACMLDAGTGGSIITIASIAAKHPDAGPTAYTVSKAGVWMLTKKAARELAAAGIRVNAIGPGYIDTNMTKLIDFVPEDRQAQLYANIPMGRKVSRTTSRTAALFLASDESSYMTGEILHPDGGYFTD